MNWNNIDKIGLNCRKGDCVSVTHMCMNVCACVWMQMRKCVFRFYMRGSYLNMLTVVPVEDVKCLVVREDLRDAQFIWMFRTVGQWRRWRLIYRDFLGSICSLALCLCVAWCTDSKQWPWTKYLITQNGLSLKRRWKGVNKWVSRIQRVWLCSLEV